MALSTSHTERAACLPEKQVSKGMLTISHQGSSLAQQAQPTAGFDLCIKAKFEKPLLISI